MVPADRLRELPVPEALRPKLALKRRVRRPRPLPEPAINPQLLPTERVARLVLGAAREAPVHRVVPVAAVAAA